MGMMMGRPSFGPSSMSGMRGGISTSMMDKAELHTSPWLILKRLGTMIAGYQNQLWLAILCVLGGSFFRRLDAESPMPVLPERFQNRPIIAGGFQHEVLSAESVAGTEGFRQMTGMPLDQRRMEWLLTALSQTNFPMACPHGRPIALRYSMRDILKSFHRI